MVLLGLGTLHGESASSPLSCVACICRSDPLEEGGAPHSSMLAWKIPWMEEPGRLQSMGSQKVRLHFITQLDFLYLENN